MIGAVVCVAVQSWGCWSGWVEVVWLVMCGLVCGVLFVSFSGVLGALVAAMAVVALLVLLRGGQRVCPAVGAAMGCAVRGWGPAWGLHKFSIFRDVLHCCQQTLVLALSVSGQDPVSSCSWLVGCCVAALGAIWSPMRASTRSWVCGSGLLCAEGSSVLVSWGGCAVGFVARGLRGRAPAIVVVTWGWCHRSILPWILAGCVSGVALALHIVVSLRLAHLLGLVVQRLLICPTGKMPGAVAASLWLASTFVVHSYFCCACVRRIPSAVCALRPLLCASISSGPVQSDVSGSVSSPSLVQIAPHFVSATPSLLLAS